VFEKNGGRNGEQVMKHRSNRDKIRVVTILTVLVMLATSIGAVAAAGCEADIEGEFRKENEGSDHKIYVWKADVTTEEICADVEFVLWVREVDRDGETTEQNHLFKIKVSSREVKSRKVNHVVPLGTEVTDWRFKIYDCKPCGE
jgi:hypothetical protein